MSRASAGCVLSGQSVSMQRMVKYRHLLELIKWSWFFAAAPSSLCPERCHGLAVWLAEQFCPHWRCRLHLLSPRGTSYAPHRSNRIRSDAVAANLSVCFENKRSLSEWFASHRECVAATYLDRSPCKIVYWSTTFVNVIFVWLCRTAQLHVSLFRTKIYFTNSMPLITLWLFVKRNDAMLMSADQSCIYSVLLFGFTRFCLRMMLLVIDEYRRAVKAAYKRCDETDDSVAHSARDKFRYVR